MLPLRTFTKEFRLYGIRDNSDPRTADTLYIAKDGEAYQLFVNKDEVVPIITATYREIFPLKLSPVPDFGFPNGCMVNRIETAPQQYITKLYGQEIKLSLEDELKMALDREDYVCAAQIRDKLKKLNQ